LGNAHFNEEFISRFADFGNRFGEEIPTQQKEMANETKLLDSEPLATFIFKYRSRGMNSRLPQFISAQLITFQIFSVQMASFLLQNLLILGKSAKLMIRKRSHQ
jgi:hypothetical protein